MGTPRTWFPETYPRIVDFIPLHSIQAALAELGGEPHHVFKFEGIVSVSATQARKIIDVHDKEADIDIEVIRGDRNYTRIRHPLTGKLDIEIPPRPQTEIIERVEDITGMPELTPEIVIKDRGLAMKLPRSLEEEIQGIDSLYRYERSRYYQPKPMREILGVRFFKPFKTMRDEVAVRLKKALDMRRCRSILETKWIVGKDVGFKSLAPSLLSIEEALTANKFNQDVAIYHKIANQYLNGIQVGGRVYTLWRRDELIPLWHEELA